MKSLRHSMLFLLALLATAPIHAESTLPNDSDKNGWHQLSDLFAECSAVYNVAAKLKNAPAQGNSSYRELADNALIAGMHSTTRAGLDENYLESTYSAKFNLWQESSKDKAQAAKLFTKADQCLKDSLSLQNQLVGALRGHTAHQ